MMRTRGVEGEGRAERQRANCKCVPPIISEEVGCAGANCKVVGREGENKEGRLGGERLKEDSVLVPAGRCCAGEPSNLSRPDR